jgi:ABC-type branched-subunit amino acid transport system substrate-binding protein
VSLPLTGRHARQGEQARRGLELWRHRARGVDLHVLDDGSSPRSAVDNVRTLAREGTDILLGPYGRAAGLAVAAFTCDAGLVLWNHGCSADDIARPLVVSLPTPASRYLAAVIDLAVARGCRQVTIAANDAPFGRTVAQGGLDHAAAAGLTADFLPVPPGTWPAHHDQLARAATDDAAMVLCGRLDDDIESVAALRALGKTPAVLAAVGAGVAAFGAALGHLADGVVGPSQWEFRDVAVDVGPPAVEMVAGYRERYRAEPDYLSVQAWAAAALATAARAGAGAGAGARDVWEWALAFHGCTAYGDFALTADGRQVGHRLGLVEWAPDRRRRVLG